MTDDKKKVIKINQDSADKLRKAENHKTLFEETKDGSLKTTSVKNVVLILKTDKNLQNLFKFNEFTNEVDVVRDANLNTSIGKISINEGQYTDQVINSVELYIESSKKYNGAVFKNTVIDQGITNVAYMNSYNPVIDYMNEAYAKYDGKRRLDDLFPQFLGAEKSEANILITRLWFMGAVAKAYDPKTKFDFVLDIVGGQGAGKTTMLQKLAPLGLYTDQFNTFTNKDDFEVMKNALIVNDDEMTASNAASFEEIKKFITMQVFEYRKSYARKSERFMKKFVMARTTNEVRHLKDRSGDRRFISIYVNKKKQKINPVTDLQPNYVKQIWGEAVWLYKQAKDPFLLSPGQEELLKENREQFRYTSGLEEELMDVLDNKFKDKNFIKNTELAFTLFADR
ncbi:MAG: virulence-associated E family protein, partial [Lactobacillus sp.]|uniref:VapE domain-containing protein n=1 Tax=Lactobacillus sp. TaxID=1591 RepID=UPI002648F0F3